MEPAENEDPSLPAELMEDVAPEHAERFDSTTAIGTSKEVIGASLGATTETAPPPPLKPQQDAPSAPAAPEIFEATGKQPSFTETTPFAPPNPGASRNIPEEESDFTETMPVRPPGSMKATTPTSPPAGYSEPQSTPPPIPSEAPPAAPSPTDELSAELEELDFYLENELEDEARELLEEIQTRFGDSPEIDLRRAQLDA